MKRLTIIAVVMLVLLAAVLPSYAASFDDHKATAYMNIKFECGCTRTGTGAMIGRRGLITCAHNLICFQHSKWLKSCTFIFGAKSANSGQKKVTSGYTYTVYDTFENGYSGENDIGYVIFEQPIGDSTGWYAWQVGSDEFLNEEVTHVNYYTYNGRFNELFTIQYVSNSKQLKLDDNPGDGDGAPVYLAYEGLDWPTVVGVFTTGGNGKGYARRLTNQVADDMRAAGAFN